MTHNSKIAIITGSTSGIGKETAKALADEGMHLVLPVRNMEKGEILKKELEKTTGNTNVALFQCDLESLDSIRAFVAAFKEKYESLHLLINNAGVWFSKRELTKDGYEKNFAVNHLAHFLLTVELLELLKKNTHARIINVSSEAHKFSRMNFDDLQSEKSFSSFKAYGQSKLANILFTRHLAKLLTGTGVTANCLHPGVVSTNLFDKMNGFMKSVFKLFMTTPQKGATTTIYLALSEEVKSKTALYFKKKKAVTPQKYALNEADAEKLWALSLDLIKG